MELNPSHADFYKNILEKRKNTAVFRKIVFHSHSPHSHDWLSHNEQFKDQSIDELEIYFSDEIKNSGIDVIAITDHMKCDFACKLSAQNIESPIILPGMEINVTLPKPFDKQGKLHLIAIFKKAYSFEQFTRILHPSIPEESKRDGHEIIDDLLALVKKIHESGGICIAAHVDSDSGTRTIMRSINNRKIEFFNETDSKDELDPKFSEVLNQWIVESGIDAVEIANHNKKVHYEWLDNNGVTRRLAALNTNDGHTIDDIKKDTNINYVKVTDIGLPDIRRAFNFSNTRLRFPSELPDTPSPRILGIRILGKKECYFENLEIAFSDNLSCLIGPRGAGKSTIIEAIRYLFGYNKTLDEINGSNSSDLKKKVIDLQKNTLKGGLIQLLYQIKSGDVHVLEATYDSEEVYVTNVFDMNNNDLHVSSVEESGEYPLRLYGWSEIETIGREPSRQIKLLDRYVDGLNSDMQIMDELRRQLKEYRKNISAHVERLKNIESKENGILSKYKEIKQKYEVVNTEEIIKIFSEYDSTKEKYGFLSEFQGYVKRKIDEIQKLRENISFIDFSKGISPNIENWWNEFSKNINISILDTDVSNLLNAANNKIITFNDYILSAVGEIREELEQKNKEILDRTHENIEDKVDIDLRKYAKERLDKVDKIRKEHIEEKNEIEKLLEKWFGICFDIQKCQQAITEKRRAQKDKIISKLNQFNTDQINITINFEEGANRDQFKTHLEEGKVLSKNIHGNYKQKQLPDKIARSCTPIQFALAIIDRHFEEDKNLSLVNHFTKIGKLSEAEAVEIASNMIITLYPFKEDEFDIVETIDPEKMEKILKIAEIPWDDKEGILLNDKPVEFLSPGQRSSAMIPLIALAERSPLIIDQPEDNLDNRLVGGTLSDILSELKETRQIIVATHNPNIVVSGDAEQVIVLDADISDENINFGKCVEAGSIDRDAIVNKVIEIMEGGRDAFEARKRRYEM